MTLCDIVVGAPARFHSCFSTETAPKLEHYPLPIHSFYAKLSPEVLTMTTPASAIKEEVWELIDDQIESFGRLSRLTPSELSECHYPAERIKTLGQELDRIRGAAILEKRPGKAA